MSVFDLKIKRQDYRGFRGASLPLGTFDLGSAFSGFDVVLRFKQGGETVFELQSTEADGLNWSGGVLSEMILSPEQIEDLWLPRSLASYTISVENGTIFLPRVRGTIDIQPNVEDL